MNDFLKRIVGRDENLPPKLPKNMEITGSLLDNIPPPIPSNKGSGMTLSSLPPPFPKGVFVAGGMGFGVSPPPLPTPQKIEKVTHDDDDDDIYEHYQTIDPVKHPNDPLRHSFDGAYNDFNNF